MSFRDVLPWTKDELSKMLPNVERTFEQTQKELEAEGLNPRPLPPMTVDDCEDYFCRLLGIAEQRPLTRQESFLFGSLFSVYRQAVVAYTKGYKGAWFCISEDQMKQMTGQ